MENKKPTLLILAAGLGSRYGSLKQIDQIGPSGERIIDYSVYDAIKAGFGKIVYVIRESFKKEFKEVILDELPSDIETDIVCQELDSLPPTFSYSKERTKPWGTGHALIAAAAVIKEPFVVINADDFYGAESFKIAVDFLASVESDIDYGLIGYKIKNTLSEYGSVSRGVCETDRSNYLSSIVERKEIRKSDNKITFKDEDDNWNPLTGDEIISMNMFAFTPSVFKSFEEDFEKFIEKNGYNLTAEFLMPSVIDTLINSNKAKVEVVKTNANWFGLTFPEDKPIAREKISELVKNEVYPHQLWT